MPYFLFRLLSYYIKVFPIIDMGHRNDYLLLRLIKRLNFFLTILSWKKFYCYNQQFQKCAISRKPKLYESWDLLENKRMKMHCIIMLFLLFRLCDQTRQARYSMQSPLFRQLMECLPFCLIRKDQCGMCLIHVAHRFSTVHP
mmetsp:Transcript_4295/g.5059  ORF Transcript_4295/g.5059 Transcript_4295/m.5059 type:complete len:142 (+) Transcript_4295:122-547(+)